MFFNFPHVGGLTKDVNRQVRANQGWSYQKSPHTLANDWPSELLVGFFKSGLGLLSSNGRLVVTIFEGEPYELWNIRDLARHVGLRVERSFVFQAAAYPEYHHARTLGSIEGGGGWKGEDRQARTYIFADNSTLQSMTPKKRTRDDTSPDCDWHTDGLHLLLWPRHSLVEERLCWRYGLKTFADIRLWRPSSSHGPETLQRSWDPWKFLRLDQSFYNILGADHARTLDH